MSVLTRILLGALSLLVVAQILPGITITSLYIALITALLLGIINAVVRPVLIVLTLPITIVTLGLFMFVINALLFWFVASFIEGFTVASFWWALLGSVCVSLLNSLGNKFLSKN